MAKRVRDKNLESRAAREALPASGKPYYRAIAEGLHLGYRKGKRARKWVARLYDGVGYSVETIGTADDLGDADGEDVLTFWQAQDRARELKAARAAPRIGAGPYTVGRAIADYIEWQEERGKPTADTITRANALILPDLGSIELAKLTTDKIRAWHRDLAKRPPRLRTKPGADQRFKVASDDPEAVRRRRSTANRTLTIFKAALNHAWREGKAASDAAWRPVKPFGEVEASRVRYLTVAEARRLLNACDAGFRKMVQAALQTGARYSELARLQVEDVNLDVGTIAIRQSKSGKPRHVVLTEEGVEFFKQMVAGRHGSEPVFRKANGTAWAKSHQNRPMIDACERAKIDPPIGFHGLRHTWASLSVMANVPLMVVAKNMGHADTRMVERHYGHLAPSFVADAIRAGAPRFGAVEPSNVEPLAGRL